MTFIIYSDSTSSNDSLKIESNHLMNWITAITNGTIFESCRQFLQNIFPIFLSSHRGWAASKLSAMMNSVAAKIISNHQENIVICFRDTQGLSSPPSKSTHLDLEWRLHCFSSNDHTLPLLCLSHDGKLEQVGGGQASGVNCVNTMLVCCRDKETISFIVEGRAKGEQYWTGNTLEEG